MGLISNSRPPGNGRSEEDDGMNLSRGKLPSMPQWFLDQQRRSGSMSVGPIGRCVVESFRGEETVPGPFFGADVFKSRSLNHARLERDTRGVFFNENMHESQRFGYSFEEGIPSNNSGRDDLKKTGLFLRMNVSGRCGLTDLGLEDGSERILGPSGFFERFEGARQVGMDRQRRTWGITTTRDSFMEEGFPPYNSSHAWVTSVVEHRRGPASPHRHCDARGGILKYQTGRMEREDAEMSPQQLNVSSSREEQLLHEHGLLHDVMRGPVNSGILSLAGGPDECWESYVHAPGEVLVLMDGRSGSAQIGQFAKILLHPSVATSTEVAPVLHNRQQVRSVKTDQIRGAVNMVDSERSPVNVEKPFIERLGSGVEPSFIHGPATNVDSPQDDGQSNHCSNMPLLHEGLDELCHSKHFHRPKIEQGHGGLAVLPPSDALPVQPLTPPILLGMREDGFLSQEVSVCEASQNWAKEQGLALGQDTEHEQQFDRRHPQGPLELKSQSRVLFAALSELRQQNSHEGNQFYLQARGQQPVRPTSGGNFEDSRLAAQYYPHDKSSFLQISDQRRNLIKQIPIFKPIHLQQVSNGHQSIQLSQPTQLPHHHHQREHLLHAPCFIQTQDSHMHQHIQHMPHCQGPLPHQMQQQGQGGQLHSPRFYLSTQEVYQSFGTTWASVNGSSMEPIPRTAPDPVSPSTAHQDPVPVPDAPPLPRNAADAPPQHPPSPPHCQPSPNSPLMAVPTPPPAYLLQQPPSSTGLQYLRESALGEFRSHGQLLPLQPTQQPKPKFVDAVSIFRRPGCLSRPDRIVVILRGLPGSGKSYLAKALRDVELMNGGSAPRIHSIDDYFMTEVEKVEYEAASVTSSSSLRSKKRIVTKVLEYYYEPEMEEVYRGSMLKAFRKTLDEGMFSFVIVDDRNVLVADFAQFWAIAKRSGYEVYILEPPYRDPAGCAARNVHNFKKEQIQEMAKRWEPAPPMYLHLDVSTLFGGDSTIAQDITEVEMDTDDMEREVDQQAYQSTGRIISSPKRLKENDEESPRPRDRWDDSDGDVGVHLKPTKRKRFGQVSKSNSGSSGSSSAQVPGNDALSGLMQAYGKREKSVHWADRQDECSATKFSIGSAFEEILDLEIGPGPGYNKASNPVQTEDSRLHKENEHFDQSKKFMEQYRAEQDAFKAVFAVRHQRASGSDVEDWAD